MTEARAAWGWQLETRGRPWPDEGSGPVLWTDVTGMTVRGLGEGVYLVTIPGLAQGHVDTAARTIAIAPLDPQASEETLDHLLVDQLLPRALAHAGDLLLLHAGAVNVEGRAVLFLGTTGAGKSTLTASFALAGHALLGDDSQALRLDGEQPQVRAVAPGLRLLPDALAALYPDASALSPLAHYSPKQRLGGVAAPADWVPVAAICVLEPARDDAPVASARLEPAASAIAILANSFALDPADKPRAAHRLALASRLAERVPVHALRCPRRFDRLPEARGAVMSLLAQPQERP